MLPSEIMIWQPEFTDKTLSRKPGAVQALEKIGSLDQAVKERDKSISDLNQTIETMNKADQHFHSQEVKNESEQAKYADRQMERKAEVQKQLVASGSVRQRIPVDTQRLLRESISEFNADADKG
nr:ppfA [Escherichia coli]